MGRFLFPEDEETIRGLCVQVMALDGHVVDAVETGVEALPLVASMEYDGIVSDGGMPGMHGPELLARVQPLVDYRVPCALKSAHGRETLFEMGAPYNVRWYVQKPFAPSELIRVGREMLRRRVDWLLAGQANVALPPRPDGQWVEFEALETYAWLSAGLYGTEPWTEGEPRTLRAPSPYAALQWLAATVRDWHALLAPPGVGLDGHDLELQGTDFPDATDVYEQVRLGDTALRLAAADQPESLRTRLYLALCCARFGWRWRVADGVDLVVDAPVEVRRQGTEIHAEDGPALRYRDGWSVYALRGMPVPAHVITSPESITLEEIRGTRHAEVRRILRERYGEERYLADVGARVVDVDTVPVDAQVPGGRCITRALLEDDERRRFLVATDGSTGRVYHMEVPGGCGSCAAAYEALSGRPGVRTLVQA